MNELVAFAGAVNHVISISKATFETRDELKLQSLKLEFTNASLELVQQQMALTQGYQSALDANVTLKKQLAEFDRWEQESKRYKLHEIARGFLVYVLKPECASGEPPHYLCTTCFHDRQKSILNPTSVGSKQFFCPRNPAHEMCAETLGGSYVSG